MLFLRSWLEEYIDLSQYSNEQLSELITDKSSEVEGFETIKDYFGGKVLVGKIENLRKHPDADRLNIFDVNLGQKGKVQIVSAAPNAREGLLVPTALEGAKLPGLTIAPRKMRGEESQGMCCGKSELMLETRFSTGLWELDCSEENLGKSICEVYPDLFPEETVIDVSVLPDKIGTIGNYLGFALELSHSLQKPELLKPKAQRVVDPNFDITSELTKHIKDSDNKASLTEKAGTTNAFFLFDGSTNPEGEENNEYFLPKEFLKRLFLTQTNIVGGLVDLSNYLLFDIGQPTHFFNKEKTGSTDWTIEKTTQPTKFNGLGQLKKTTVPEGVGTIKSEGKILGIPGISGGDSTKMDYKDTDFILEIASFDGEEIARDSFKLKYRSDAAKIWIGGVNSSRILLLLLHLIESFEEYPESTNGQKIKLDSILTWFKEKPANSFEEGAKRLLEENQRKIEIDFDYLAERLDGQPTETWKPKIEKWLESLGEYKNGKLTTNIFYSNLKDREDIYGEIARLIGFKNLKQHDIVASVTPKQNPEYNSNFELKKTLLEFGFSEIITRPFIGTEKLVSVLSEKLDNPGQKINLEKASEGNLEILKAQNMQENRLRDSLLPTLLKVLSTNLKQGEKEPRIFELNKIYTWEDSEVKETKNLSAVAISDDPYLLTSVVNKVLSKTGNSIQKPTALPLILGEGRGEVSPLGKGHSYQNGNIKATLLQISNPLKKEFDLPLNKNIWFIDFDITDWDKKIQTYKKYQDESIYPPVSRAYSLFVPKDLTWKIIEKLAKKIEVKEALVNIKPTERLAEEDRDILNFEVEFVSYERTLSGEEVDAWGETLLSELKRESNEIEIR